MISSMPSIPVCRNKKEGSIGYFSRPHKLSLHFRPPLSHHQVTPTPSPINSPQGAAETAQHQDSSDHGLTRMIAKKRVFFQLSVLLPLAGALLLFVGLIQLVPGAEGKHYGNVLIVVGTTLLILGLVIITIRMFCKWKLEHYETRHPQSGDLPEIKINEPSLNDVDLEKAGGDLDSYCQSPVRRPSQQSSNPATTSFSSNNRTNTTALEQVQVSTPGAKSSSGAGRGGGGVSVTTPNNYYSPLQHCKPNP